jgi:cytochrome P450
VHGQEKAARALAVGEAQHMSFGFGIHRCVGNRLAELQLTIIWEEIMKRFPDIQLLEEPKRSYSIFVKGYEDMKVVLPSKH